MQPNPISRLSCEPVRPINTNRRAVSGTRCWIATFYISFRYSEKYTAKKAKPDVMAIHIQNSKCNESEKKNNFELNLKTGKNNNTPDFCIEQKLNIRLLNIPIQFYLNKLLFTWVNSVRVVWTFLARSSWKKHSAISTAFFSPPRSKSKR